MNTAILDCESYVSTLESLERIFLTEKAEMRGFLKNFDLEGSYNKSDMNITASEFLFSKFENRFDIKTRRIKTFWFHGTRISSKASFSRGILPLNRMFFEIERMIDDIAKSLSVRINRKKISSCETISSKLGSISDLGPYGSLVKECTFEAPDGTHSYLDIPEIVEDIIECKYKEDDEVISTEYKRLTSPCIVKFRHEDLLPLDNLSCVIYYLYHKEKAIVPFHFNCTTNKSNNGERIEHKMIEKIDFPVLY